MPEGPWDRAREQGANTAFVVILLCAAYLRLFDLGGSPAGLTAVEAALGADARFLGLTGRDVALSSWYLPRGSGDFPFPLGRWLALPFVAPFSPSVALVRLPFAIVGVGLVGLLTVWAHRCFGRMAALGTAAVAATSPISVLAARSASEHVVLAFLAVAAVSCFDRERPRLVLGSIALALIPFSLNTVGGFFLAAFGAVVAWRFGRSLRASPHRFRIVAVGILGSALIAASFVGSTDDGASRRAAISISTYEHGPRAVFFMLNAFLTSFHAGWLFVQAGDGGLPGLGVFSWVELPLLLAGVLRFVERPSREVGFVILWVVAGFVPATIAFEAYEPNRIAGAAPAVHVLAGVGFAFLLERAKMVRAQTKYAALALFAVAELATLLAVYSAISSRRHAANPRFHVEAVEALRCAHEYRAASCAECRIALSPNLPDAVVYATFFEPREMIVRAERTTILETRSRASPREIVVASDKERGPSGIEICRKTSAGRARVAVVVSAARPIVERKPELEAK